MVSSRQELINTLNFHRMFLSGMFRIILLSSLFSVFPSTDLINVASCVKLDKEIWASDLRIVADFGFSFATRDRIQHEAEWNSNFTYVTNNTVVWIPRGIVSSGTDGYLEFPPSVSWTNVCNYFLKQGSWMELKINVCVCETSISRGWYLRGNRTLNHRLVFSQEWT